jgi:hypothetical protein
MPPDMAFKLISDRARELRQVAERHRFLWVGRRSLWPARPNGTTGSEVGYRRPAIWGCCGHGRGPGYFFRVPDGG